jgi:uncharacterized protein with GYD domain
MHVALIPLHQGDTPMAKYLFEASYTAEGTKGLVQDGGTGRRKQVEDAVKKAGGTIESFYFAFGNPDVFVVADVPDAATAAAFSLAINQTGLVQLRTRVLLTPEEMDQATKKSVDYRAPGR